MWEKGSRLFIQKSSCFCVWIGKTRHFPNIEVVKEGDRFYVMGRGYIVDLDGPIAEEFRSHLNF